MQPLECRPATNLRNLAGMHDVAAKNLALVAGISEDSTRDIMNCKRAPSGTTAVALGAAFGDHADILWRDTQSALQAAAAVFDDVPIRRPSIADIHTAIGDRIFEHCTAAEFYAWVRGVPGPSRATTRSVSAAGCDRSDIRAERHTMRTITA
jgi:hypothetical protein